MTENELYTLRKLIEEIILVPTKKDAIYPISELKTIVLKNTKIINDNYLIEKLNEILNYAESATGNVNNKQHWVDILQQKLDIFENDIKRYNKTS